MSNTGRLKMQKMLCTEGTIAGASIEMNSFPPASQSISMLGLVLLPQKDPLFVGGTLN